MKNRHWKADEMEMAINFKAMRYSWIFLVLSLTIWCVVDFAASGEFPTIPFILEAVSGTIFWLVKIVLTNKMTESEQKDGEE